MVLKADRFYADVLQDAVQRFGSSPTVRVSVTLAEARDALASKPVDVLIAGMGFADGDLLDPLAGWIATGVVRRALVVTGRKEPWLLLGLRSIGVTGVFDPLAEGPEALRRALRAVASGMPAWSPSVLAELKAYDSLPHSVSRVLTPTEQLILAVIGDGCDDHEASRQLGLSSGTILTVRRELHRKLGVRQKAELIRIAVQHGFVRFAPQRPVRPGFRLLLAASTSKKIKAWLAGKSDQHQG
jgi:DNA-binding NarL/FixJ family response regulator